VFCKYVLSAGLFGFSGGITNWLAVKLLFDRVPLLVSWGSSHSLLRFLFMHAWMLSTVWLWYYPQEVQRDPSELQGRHHELVFRRGVPANVHQRARSQADRRP
jgi:hypothetical protein